MTRTLTTEQLRARIAHYRELAYRYGMSGNPKHEAQYRDDAAFLEELLANREAQPVAMVDRRPAASGSICWQNGGKDLPHGTELFTAPPAPAVPDKKTFEQVAEEVADDIGGYSIRDCIVAALWWNACRAAMVAAAPEGGNDHDTRR